MKNNLQNHERRHNRSQESTNTVELENGSRVLLRSLSESERIISYDIHTAVLDEIDAMNLQKVKDAYLRVTGRSRLPDKELVYNQLVIVTTPKVFTTNVTDMGSMFSGANSLYLVSLWLAELFECTAHRSIFLNPIQKGHMPLLNHQQNCTNYLSLEKEILLCKCRFFVGRYIEI